MNQEIIRAFKFAGPWSHAWPWMRVILLETAAGFRPESDRVEIVFAKKLVNSEELKRDFPPVREALNCLFGQERFACIADASALTHKILLKTCPSPIKKWKRQSPQKTKPEG